MRGYSTNFHIHVSVSDLCTVFPQPVSMPILLQENRWTNPGNILTALRHMNVEIETKAVQILFWEYIDEIFVAV